MKVLLIGGYPPPYGGVTIHIQRLCQFLMDSGIGVKVVTHHRDNHSSLEKVPELISLNGNRLQKYFQLRRVLKNTEAQIVHFHASVLDNLLLGGKSLLKLPKHSRRILTIHSGKFIPAYHSRGFFYRLMARWLLRSFDYLIAVNDDLKAFFIDEIGINPQKVVLIPTFISPKNEPGRKINPLIETRIKEIKSSSGFTVLISGYGFDYYGYDLFLDAIDRIQKTNKIEIGLVFVFYTQFNPMYKEKINDRIQRYKHHLILENLETLDFLEILNRVDLLVRPTLMDSYGVTVAEALSLGTPAIASDVCQRPSGTILVKTGDRIDLSEKMEYVINNYSEIQKQIQHIKPQEYGQVILDFYEDILLRGIDK